MMFSTASFLKLISFHHVMSDNRAFVRRLKVVTPEQAKDPSFFNIADDTFKLAVQYPKNLRIGHFIRYICVPSFCYQHSYPSTDHIRVFYLLKRFAEAFVLLLGTSYLVSQHAQVIVESSLIHFVNWNWPKIIVSTLHLSVSAAYVWLGNFYLIFHTYTNILAEVTYFADRRFYSDWWNSGNMSEYWQKWNMPIHNFLLRHIYLPLRRFGIPSSTCMFATFTFSALFHEYVVIGVFSVINGIAFFLMMVCIPIIMV
jgi:diacylglycerol O-acyltransferase-1